MAYGRIISLILGLLGAVFLAFALIGWAPGT